MIYEIELDDGRIVEIDSEGKQLTNKELLEYADLYSRRERAERFKAKAQEIRAEPAPMEELAKSVGGLEAMAIGAGKGLYNVGRGVKGLFGGEVEIPEAEKEAYQALEKQRPYTTGAGEIIGEAAPFAVVPVGGVGGAVAKQFTGQIGKRAASMVGKGLAGAGAGGLEGYVTAKGREEDTAFSTGAGAGMGLAAETLLPGVVRKIGGTQTVQRIAGSDIAKKVGNLYQRLTGKVPEGALLDSAGNPTPDFETVLKREGIDVDDFKETVKQQLQKPVDLKPEQEARKAYLESQGFVEGAAPTRAQITQTVRDFTAQQEAAKQGGKVAGRLTNQQALLKNKFDNTFSGLDPDAMTSGNPVYDQVLNRVSEYDNKINEMYEIARSVTGDKQAIDLAPIADLANKMKGQNRLSGGLIQGIKSELALKGLIDEKTGRALRKATATEAEEMIQSINRLYSKSDKNQNRIGRIFKEAIDDQVTDAGSPHLFKEARKARADYYQALERTGTKYSKRKQSLVKDVLEEKINAEDFFEKGVLSPNYRASELADLKNYLTETGTKSQREAGQKAWDDLRAQAVEYVRDVAFSGKGPEGVDIVNLQSWDKAMKKLGGKNLSKARELFTPSEMKLFGDMRKTLQLLKPVQGTGIGMGPSGQAIIDRAEKIMNTIKNLSIVGRYMSDIKLNRDYGALQMPKARYRPATGAEKYIPATARATGVASIPSLQEEEARNE